LFSFVEQVPKILPPISKSPCIAWNVKILVSDLIIKIRLKIQVITAVNMKMRALWNIAPCSVLEVDRRFRGAYFIGPQSNEFTSELSINFYKTARCSIPEGYYF
jgi:hypothetical protein